jgi:DNA-binding LytR/AlgR family response regulator
VLNSYFILEKDNDTVRQIGNILEEYPDFICIGITEDYEDGMNSILKDNPDVVFINVDVGNIGDSDVFSYCKEIDQHTVKKPLYIALSKDEDKAYKAIKNKFFDYLVFPGSDLEIRKSVLQIIKSQPGFLEGTLCLKSYKDYTLLEIDDVVFLQADNNATDFVLLSGQKVSAFKTLKSFESVLPHNFIRIHHSYIVNKNHISRINFGKLRCFLNHNSISLPFSKSYRHNLHTLEALLSQRAIFSN